ncbi:hypothetical protein J4727_19710 [Providencia rettgeri]|uniref:Uncharacterized protein n=1 Tax=Providencia rettgeri TaxID=587 RepID=A0A939SM09_PRORE|nr:hypothetical protein [Providencia rettgeri]
MFKNSSVKTIESSHGGELTAEQVVKMTQQLRDRRMAESLLNAPALLFAGGYHATSKLLGYLTCTRPRT